MHPIESLLNYRFHKPSLLRTALTHPSAGHNNYQRLEFLGDRVLGLMIADWLQKDQQVTEGVMAQCLSELTSKNHLARVGKHLGLRPYIKTQLAKEHEKKSTHNLLADVMESLIAAVFLDSGYLETCKIFLHIIVDENLWEKGERHAKNKLQEWTQKHHLELPTYTVIEEKNSSFTVQCSVASYPPTQATALQKRTAELQSAKLMLKQIGV